MSFQIHKVFFLCLVFFFWPLLILAEEIMPQERFDGFSAFYEKAAPGDVAFMLGIIEIEKDPKNNNIVFYKNGDLKIIDEYDKIEFYKMENGSSYKFPTQSAYCFILNHRRLDNKLGPGKPTYLAVEIISVMKAGPYYAQKEKVHLFRNLGWISGKNDRKLDFDEEDTDGEELSIEIEQFFYSNRWDDIDKIDEGLTYAWHGTLKGTSVSSWENDKSEIFDKKDLLEKEFYTNFQKPFKTARSYNLRVDAYLIRFTPTMLEESKKPVYFCTTCDSKRAIYLYLKVPVIDKPSEIYITIDE